MTYRLEMWVEQDHEGQPMISEIHWLRGHIRRNKEQLSRLKGLVIALMKMHLNENGLLCFCT